MKTIINSFLNGWLVFYFLRLFAFAKREFFKSGLYFWTRGFGLMGRIAMGAGLLSGGLALSYAEELEVKIQPSVAELEQMSQDEDRRVSSFVSQALGEIGDKEGLALFSEGALREEALLEFESGFPQERKENHHFDIQNRWPIDQAPVGRPADLRSEEDCLKCPSAKENIFPDPFLEESLNPLNIRSCGVVSDSHSLKEGELSDYWAQELIGSDLLREELEKYPPPEKQHFISVVDWEGDSHDESVKKLVSGEGPQAVLPELHDKISVFNVDFSKSVINTIIEYKTISQRIKQNPSSFINHSMQWYESKAVYEAFKSLSPSSIAIVSSGNAFPSPLDKMQILAAKDFDIILVGSLSPSGLVSHFSQEGEEVAILAPSDKYLTSANGQGDYNKFGGTSGAAPLVTASLAGFEWLSGYHPSPKEAKLLLQRTALPTVHSHEKPRKNGAGMLNSYKLGMVGKRLKRRCQNKARSCFSEEIQKEESYHWALDETLSGDLRRAFPSCALGGEKRISERGSCGEKRETFHRLRKAVFLADEGRESLFQVLSCIYKEAGFFENAKALNRLALALGSPGEVRAHLLTALKEGLREQNLHSALLALRALSRMNSDINSEETEQALQWLSGTPGYTDTAVTARQTAAMIAGQIGGPKGLQTLKQLAQDLLPIRIHVAQAVGKIGSSEGLELLKRLFQDESELVRSSVAQAVGEISGSEGLELLKRLSQDKSEVVRFSVAQAVGAIGGSEGLELLKRLSQDKSEVVRFSVAQAVGAIGGSEGLELLKRLSQDKSEVVRFSVAQAVGAIGGSEGLELLKRLSQDKSEVKWSDFLWLKRLAQ